MKKHGVCGMLETEINYDKNTEVCDWAINKKD